MTPCLRGCQHADTGPMPKLAAPSLTRLFFYDKTIFTEHRGWVLTWVALFSLNWVILRSQPTGVVQDSSQASSAWAGTCDCTKMQARWGSTPHAMYRAADLPVQQACQAGCCAHSWVVLCDEAMRQGEM